MLGAAVLALILANSPWADVLTHFWELPLAFTFGQFRFGSTLHFWVNEGLMSLFFLIVGLEIKREFLTGEVSTPQQRLFPIIGALGGMLVPALIYVAINVGRPSLSGWPIPMATDIAFALGILTLLRKRISSGVKSFLSTLAITDDLGAIVVIALFYTSGIFWQPFLIAATGLAALVGMNRWGVRNPYFYALVGIFGVWLPFIATGIHATISGVLVAMTIPFWSQSDRPKSPLHHIEDLLNPLVSFGVLPIFALANAGITIHATGVQSMATHASLGIVLGLVIGKPLGIFGATWLSSRWGLVSLPHGVTWSHIAGAGMLAGIGFTMSLFLADLSFAGSELLISAKLAIFAGSLISSILGTIILITAHRFKNRVG